VVAAKAEFDRIAEGGSTDDFDVGTVTEAHFQQPATEFGVTTHGKDAAAATDAELVQPAGLGRAAVITRRKST
jgi:hypothetical protein